MFDRQFRCFMICLRLCLIDECLVRLGASLFHGLVARLRVVGLKCSCNICSSIVIRICRLVRNIRLFTRFAIHRTIQTGLGFISVKVSFN